MGEKDNTTIDPITFYRSCQLPEKHILKLFLTIGYLVMATLFTVITTKRIFLSLIQYIVNCHLLSVNTLF